MRYRGSANLLIAVLLIGFLSVVLLMGIGLMGRARNGAKELIALSVAADTAWANLETALNPRFDLIPGLIEAARPYATTDQDLLTNIAEVRREYIAAVTNDGKVEAASQVERLVVQLLALQDKDPQLKADETFHALATALHSTDPAVASAGARYDDAVQAIDDYAKTPFTKRLAQKIGLHPRPYFLPAGQ
jgi:LemA protein